MFVFIDQNSKNPELDTCPDIRTFISLYETLRVSESEKLTWIRLIGKTCVN